MLSIKTHPWYTRHHHRAGGYRNVWGGGREEGLSGKALKWVVEHGFGPRPAHELPPVRTLDPAALAVPPRELRLTWMGHSTVLAQTPRLNVVTDPVFGPRASPLPFAGPDRKPALPLEVDGLPALDAVLLSHDHYDHLDRRTITALLRRQQPLFVVPLGVAAILRRWGARHVVELDWWQYVEMDGLRLHCTPARHFAGRGLDRNATLWAGWYLEPAGGPRLYYGGDSAYAPLFADVREHLGAPDVAVLPIGAYSPRWMMAPVHMEPEETVRAALDLQARHVVPVHWGTFDLADEPLHEPPRRFLEAARAAGLDGRVHLLDIGGRWDLSEADARRAAS